MGMGWYSGVQCQAVCANISYVKYERIVNEHTEARCADVQRPRWQLFSNLYTDNLARNIGCEFSAI